MACNYVRGFLTIRAGTRSSVACCSLLFGSTFPAVTTTKDPAMTDRDAARRAVRRAVEASQLGVYGFADRAGVDPGTLRDFLDGTRWPQSKNRNKIERALGWPDGRITDLADGVTPIEEPVAVVTRRPQSLPEPSPELLAAIEADDRLLPEAKLHLVNQIGLLLRLQGTRDEVAEQHRLSREEAEETPLLRPVGGDKRDGNGR